MNLYPAIDLLGGAVVRLRQGDYDDSTVYGTDPESVALAFVASGAQWVHVVDLDGKRVWHCDVARTAAWLASKEHHAHSAAISTHVESMSAHATRRVCPLGTVTVAK